MKLRLWAENHGQARTDRAPRRPLLPPAFMLVLAIFAGLLTAGCKTPQSQILLEHENFQQEKCIDDLRDQLDDARSELEECRRENAALRRGTVGGASSSPNGESPTYISPPVISPGTSGESSAPLFSPPAIDHGTQAPPALPTAPPPQSLPPPTPPSASPPPLQNGSQQQPVYPPGDAAPLAPPDHSGPDGRASASSYDEEIPAERSQPAERISIIRLLTNGHQFGGHVPIRFASSEPYGDNGLQVAFSARDAENHTVAVRGSVAMVVIDPALSGPDARVARWDFAPQELQAHFRQTLFGNAYRFDLLWPHEPPQHERLKLFIRVTTLDGRRLETHQAIYVKLGSQMPADDDSNVVAGNDADPNVADADTPAPAVEVAPSESVRQPPSSYAPSPTNSPPISQPPVPSVSMPSSPVAADMGQYEADDPAPAELTQLPSSQASTPLTGAKLAPVSVKAGLGCRQR